MKAREIKERGSKPFFLHFSSFSRQARQVREEYEERLMRANSLYQELDECMKQLRVREEEIKR